MKIKNSFLNFFGIFYITIAALAFYNALKYFGPEYVLWISYSAFLIIGIGIIFRNSYLIGSQINLVLIPYILWTIDLFYNLTVHKSLFGITDYVFAMSPSIALLVTLQHAVIVPISLIAFYFIKIKRKDFWKFSLVQIIAVFLLTRIFSDPLKNINCIFSNCIPIQFKEIPYPVMWFFLYILMIFVVNYILVHLNLFKIKKRRKTS